MSAAKWILEAYERSGEQGRMDMYMAHRDLRGDFDEIDATPHVLDVKEAPRSVAKSVAKPMRVKWRLHGRLMRASGG
ncbi:MAG: hypothetical protein P1S46_11730 [bacterium]|nr:hypothetical protein [bacterium]MDT8396777.1 hypothetical protein [bacterium]